MTISSQHVDYVAKLARLSLSEEEKKRFTGQFESILAYVDKLNELQTDDIEPLVHMSERENVFRTDETSPSLARREALENAPEQAEGCFKVPSILEQ